MHMRKSSIVNKTCANSLDSSHSTEAVKDTILMLQITNFCGIATYRKSFIYAFKLTPYHLKSSDSDTMAIIKYYFSLFHHGKCNSSQTTPSRLGLCLGYYTAQSTVFNTGELHVVGHDISLIIYYDKTTNRNCSTFKVIYHCELYQLLSRVHLENEVVLLVKYI